MIRKILEKEANLEAKESEESESESEVEKKT